MPSDQTDPPETAGGESSSPTRICPHCERRSDHRTCPSDDFSTVRLDVVRTPDDGERIGEVIAGRYRLEAFLERGGFGAIYRARQLGLGRDVAIKLMHPNNAERLEDIARFQQEARVVGRLNHPNIVHLYDFGEMEDGHFFMAMEFLRGRSLKRVVARDAPLEAERLRRLVVQVLGALEASHNIGIIHRDVAPKNVIVGRDGGGRERCTLIDFGIARVMGHDAAAVTLTGTDQIVGSPQYMAPERWTGVPVTDRSDLYGVGCLILEALTGEPVIEKQSLESYLTAILFNGLRPPLVDGRRVTGRLVDFALDCLAKDPAERPASATAARARLEAIDADDLLDEPVETSAGESSDDAGGGDAAECPTLTARPTHDEEQSAPPDRPMAAADTWLAEIWEYLAGPLRLLGGEGGRPASHSP